MLILLLILNLCTHSLCSDHKTLLKLYKDENMQNEMEKKEQFVWKFFLIISSYLAEDGGYENIICRSIIKH